MTEKTIDLDVHRGMSAQKATNLRRLLADVEANEKELRLRQDELESHLLAAPADNWHEAADKVRYLLSLFTATLRRKIRGGKNWSLPCLPISAAWKPNTKRRRRARWLVSGCRWNAASSVRAPRRAHARRWSPDRQIAAASRARCAAFAAATICAGSPSRRAACSTLKSTPDTRLTVSITSAPKSRGRSRNSASATGRRRGRGARHPNGRGRDR